MRTLLVVSFYIVDQIKMFEIYAMFFSSLLNGFIKHLIKQNDKVTIRSKSQIEIVA